MRGKELKMDKSKIFTAAWAVARKGAVKFGGKAREYFSEALKMAYAHLRNLAAKAAPVATSTVNKVHALATIMISWPRHLRGSFAYRFVLDNADRALKFGNDTKFSEKQIAIINDLYSKHA